MEFQILSNSNLNIFPSFPENATLLTTRCVEPFLLINPPGLTNKRHDGCRKKRKTNCCQETGGNGGGTEGTV